MKALFLTSWTDDYISACLWDGLQDAIGQDNVIDAGWASYLHSHGTNRSASWRVGGHHIGPCLDFGRDHRNCDLLVINAAMLRDHDWHWPINLKEAHCRPDCKVVFIEGGDGWNEINVPPFHIDAFFRREIAVGVEYPYKCRHLTFSAPMRWFDGSGHDNRTYDIFSANAYHSHPIRWEMLQHIFRTQTKHISIVGTGSVSEDRYLDYLRASKLAICCPGGASSDCMRFAEVPACGAIPVFVGVSKKIRENWYTEEHAYFTDTADGLPDVLDNALISTARNAEKRRALLEHARTYFSTKAMAEKVLKEVGLM